MSKKDTSQKGNPKFIPSLQSPNEIKKHPKEDMLEGTSYVKSSIGSSGIIIINVLFYKLIELNDSGDENDDKQSKSSQIEIRQRASTQSKMKDPSLNSESLLNSLTTNNNEFKQVQQRSSKRIMKEVI